MNENQQAAYVVGIAVNCLVEAMGMHAENMKRQEDGQSIAYTHDDFSKLLESNGLYHNGILGMFGR